MDHMGVYTSFFSMIICQLKLKYFTCLNGFPKNTRGSTRTVFKTSNYEGALYKRSPYFVGAKLSDSLSVSDIELPDIYSFKSRLKRLNNVYIDLLA